MSVSEPTEAKTEQVRPVFENVRDELLAQPGVRGAYVGLLRDQAGSLTDDVGIVVIIDPHDEATGRHLPTHVGQVEVQVVRGAPGPEGSHELPNHTEGTR